MTEITKREAYIDFKNKLLTQIAELDVDVLTLERTDPKTIVAYDTVVDKKGQESQHGRLPIEIIPRIKAKRSGLEERLSALEILLK